MKKFLSLLLIIGLCTSCKQNMFITNDVNVQEINDVVLIEPQTEIGLITKGNNVFANDSLSDVASRNLEKILTYSVRHTHVTSIEHIGQNQEINNFIFHLSHMQKNEIEYVTIPSFIDSLIESSGKRYGLIARQSGFTRTRWNRTAQVTKAVSLSVLSAVLTLGMAYVYVDPIVAVSEISLAIIDSYENKVVFFNMVSTENEPLDETKTSKLIFNLFEMAGIGKN